jgi:hydrogenase-1 operon protein HyaF
MSSLDAIKVAVEGSPAPAHAAQNALPVLHEIRHALDKLATTGEPTVIDLSAIPFGPGDRDQLFEVLGKGEVEASVNALGETRVSETRYAGVWLVQHFSPQGNDLATHIEVTRLPGMLVTPEQDIADASRALAEHLQQDSD